MAHISGITDRRILAQLLSAGQASSVLRRDSTEVAALEALDRTLLYLGFGPQLDWPHFGADGHYEDHTQAAVAAFAVREGLAGDGAQVTPEQLTRLLARYDEAVEQDRSALAALREAGQVSATLQRSGTDAQRIRVLQRLLYVAGFGDEMKWDKFGDDGDYGANTTRAVAAFAAAAPAPGDGSELSDVLAEKLIAAVSENRERPTPLVLDQINVVGNKMFLVTASGKKQIASLVRFRSRQGWQATGEMPFASFLQARPDVFAGQPPSLLHVLQAVVENEGKLDGVNAYDDSFLSFGILQWTSGAGENKGELAAFLQFLLQKDPLVFQKYFGVFNLNVAGVSGGKNTPATGFFVLRGQRLDTVEKKNELRQPDWVYRFRNAGHDPVVQQAQTEYAQARLSLFYRNPSQRIKGRFVADYVSSEVGVALIFDQHVNRPGHVLGTLTQAVADVTPELGDPATWDTEVEQRFLDRYLTLRHATSMTDSRKRAAQVRQVAGPVVSAQRGSFRI
jgi:peptidoglycan hydrolase-like protein with peptidoglycan-binding domain